METRHKYIILIIILLLAAAILVTCQAAGEPVAAEQSEAVPTVKSPPPTVKPTHPEPTKVVLPSPTPTVFVEKSPLWYTYHDPRYGYGMALPCFWSIYPTRADAVSGSPGIASYDEPFAMAHSVRGAWVDGIVPDRAVKIDIFTYENIDTSVPFIDAVAAILEDMEIDPAGIDPFHEFAEDAYIVKTDVEGDDPYSLIIPDQHVIFPLSESAFSMVTVYPRAGLDNPDIQAILNSFVPTIDKEIQTPVEDPQTPVEGRDYYVDPDSGYCFSYPLEAAVETFAPEEDDFAGKAFILTVEREVYSILLSGGATNVPDNYTLNDFVGKYLMETYGVDPGQVYIYSEPFGGQESIIIEGIPEDPGIREVLTLVDNRLYHLKYTNTAPEDEQAVNALSELHFILSSSMTFLP